MTDGDALFEIRNPDTSSVPSKPKRSGAEVAKTPTGQNAGDIIGQWVGLCKERTDGVPVPSTIVKRMARQVMLLIKAGYSTNQIKLGLTVWTVRWFENSMLSPTTLEQLTWRVSIDASRAGREFQAEMQRAKEVLVGQTATVAERPGTAQERRQAENTRGEVGWRERAAARKRQEKEMGLNG